MPPPPSNTQKNMSDDYMIFELTAVLEICTSSLNHYIVV